MIIVAFQGISGAYSEIAAQALYPGCRTQPQPRFQDVFSAVTTGQADAGVIPVENSLGGSIHENYDLLAKNSVTAVAETYVRVNHALLGRAGSHLNQIRKVRSHYQALAQCASFFERHPDIIPVLWYDTAGAARSIARSKSDSAHTLAAIASEKAAEIYGLKILKRRLQDSPQNFTRFLAITRTGSTEKPSGATATKREGRPDKAYKTSLTFIPKRNRPGVLNTVTHIFASQGIDLTKIESRPDPQNAFDYRFYLDVAGDASKAPLKPALTELKHLVRDFHVIGSYPCGKLPK